MPSSIRLLFMPACAVALTLAACAGAPERSAATAEHCVPEVALYDWKKLDTSNLIVWSLPAERAYHLDLAGELEALGSAEAIELVDGNGDGMLCGNGWDSLVAADAGASIGASEEASGEAPREGETIALVAALDEQQIARLRERFAGTRGERIHATEPAS